MKLTLIRFAALGLVLGWTVVPARAEWLHYLVRSSGLAWSDGYHAYDQCPPKQAHHFPIRVPGYSSNSWGNCERPGPYYFEETQPTGPELNAAPAQGETLPPAPPVDSRAPNPQARYQPRNRYFQALEAESRGGMPAQAVQLEARRPDSPRQPANRPPF
jgi:hypothetical protein